MTDEQILTLYWERSEDAIRETDKVYGKYCNYIARNILADPEDAKETVNDAYLKAWQQIPPERPNPLKTFLGRITRQLSINRLEKNTAQKRGGGQYAAALEELAEVISIPQDDLADRIALRDVLNRFLWSLPTVTRRLFVGRYWYMQTVNELSQQYSISVSAVKMQLLRARQKLRDHLEKEGFL